MVLKELVLISGGPYNYCLASLVIKPFVSRLWKINHQISYLLIRTKMDIFQIESQGHG